MKTQRRGAVHPRALPIGNPNRKGVILPEGGEVRRRALARLLAPRVDFDAATREAQEAGRGR